MSDTPRTDAASVSREYIEREMDRYTQKFVLADHMSDLERELVAAMKDAERYRWLRERHENTIMDIYNSIPAMKPELLDAAIDAAIMEKNT